MSRFERKIVFAILVVALVPLLGALVLGRAALRDAYEMGVNEELREQLERGLDVRRSYLAALRADADRTSDAVAYDWRLRAAVDENDRERLLVHLQNTVEAYPNVAGVVVRHGEEVFASVSREVAEDRRTSLRERTVPDLADVPITVEVHVTAPSSPFVEFQEAGEAFELYSRLEERAGYISEVYVWVYIALLLSVILLAAFAALVLSRRVTKRVVSLADATREVGRGDLSVRVPVEADDEIAELTASFNAMVEDLQTSHARIDYLSRIGAWQQFARRLAHEIKNPLTPIQLAAQEMHRSYRGEDEAYGRKLDVARDIIEEEVATLRRLVSEFSDFARLPEASLERADLRDFLSDVERSVPAILEDVAREEAIEVSFSLADEPAPAAIDAMMLKRCVDNLIRNAVQALRDEGRGGNVLVMLTCDEEVAQIAVDDDGPGIAEDKRADVFAPYFTTKSDGTGLGLAIVKKVVLEHRGEIRCVASARGGARFEIELPFASS